MKKTFKILTMVAAMVMSLGLMGCPTGTQGCVHTWTLDNETPATCTKEGVKTSHCELCGEIKTETTTTIDHDFSVLVETVSPTETTEGYDLYKCSGCELTEKRNITPAIVHEHKYTVVTKEATCTEDGVKKCSCSAEETIPATGHSFDVSTLVLGYNENIKCDGCDETVKNYFVEKYIEDGTVEYYYWNPTDPYNFVHCCEFTNNETKTLKGLYEFGCAPSEGVKYPGYGWTEFEKLVFVELCKKEAGFDPSATN